MGDENIDATSGLVYEAGTDEDLGLKFTGVTRLGTVERLNLLNITKLSIKTVIEYTARHGVNVDDFSPQIQQLFILLEHIMKHRLKAKRNLLGSGKKGYWSLVEAFEKSSPEMNETITSVRSLPNIKTTMGRGRAWLRWALMQKHLADFFKCFAEHRRTVGEWYDQEAFLMNEEGVVIGGLLMGLNVIDYNVIMKGEDYDRPLGIIDLSQYLKDGNYLGKPPDLTAPQDLKQNETTSSVDSTKLSKLIDQKAFLEERNKKLELTVEKLQKGASQREAENEGLKATLSNLEAALSESTNEKEQLKIVVDRSSEDLERKMKVLSNDREVERDALTAARSGLKDLYSASQKQLDTEMKLRHDIEKELEVQRNLRSEKETALSLLEKDVLEKQTTIVSLRKQLEEMKSNHVKLQSQLQYQKQTTQDQSARIATLEARVSQLSGLSKQQENTIQQAKSKLSDFEKAASEMGTRMQELQLMKNKTEADFKVEKEWRESLQKELQKEKDRNVELQHDSRKLKTLEEEYSELKEHYATLQDTINDQEQALAEMAMSLSESKRHMAEQKHTSAMMMSQKWADDKDISKCQQCSKEFNVARRKHHCRSCGGIFCFACSDNTMKLASSSKPVRVCDKCHTLLQKSTVTTGASSSLVN